MTIKDIAREAGYAVGTVSRVLNHRPDVSEEARQKIMAVVEKHHFQLNNNAKHLKQQTSTGIALVVKGTQNMLFAALVEALQGLIKSKGYVCLIYYIDEDDNEVTQALQILRERRPQGILFLGSTLRNFREAFAAVEVPCVMVTNSAQELGFANLSSISTDDAAAARFAMEHLMALGHRNIGILGGKMERSPAACARYQGCIEAFRQAGVPFDSQRQYESARFAMDSGAAAMDRLLDKFPDMTAVFAMSDVMAVGAIRAIRDRGLQVPEDMSVMGFDGIALGQYLAPRLTTIEQNAALIARRSVEQLLGCIEEHRPPVHEVVPYRLVEGGSVRPLPASKGREPV